jgi:membrane-associated protein
MDLLATFIDIVLHLDKHLAVLLAQYGTWIYAILFLIIFMETGFVVTPFLPGDSLLFVAGALAALPPPPGSAEGMDIRILCGVLLSAAILGDNVNYWIGHYVGPKVFRWEQSRLFNRAAFDKTHAFYEKHGGKTIIYAQFVPILRTFAPFVAGVAGMPYSRFLSFNIFGAIGWVVSMTVSGYFLGGLPFVRAHFEKIIYGIILVSVLPIVIQYLRSRNQPD